MSQLKVNSIVPVGGLPAGANGGGIIQVVSAAKTDTSSLTPSGTAVVDIPGLSCSITATASGNKMFITAMVAVSSSSSGMGLLLRRDSNKIFEGDEASSRGQLTTNVENQGNTVDCKVVPITFLDTAPDTSAHTYKISVQETDGGGNTFRINRGTSDSDQSNRTRVVSSITVMEVTT
tara:strand:+ start:935 stop:1465 length:531 start_codon:yes stop_codon:yes gene_type:complete